MTPHSRSTPRRFVVLCQCLGAAALLALVSCANHTTQVHAAFEGAEVVHAEHMLDDDSTVVLVLRARDGKLWSVRNTLVQPQEVVIRSPKGWRWKTTDLQSTGALRQVAKREFKRLSEKRATADRDEMWKLRTLGELIKRLMSDPHSLRSRPLD